MTEIFRFDAPRAVKSKRSKTEDGYLVVDAAPARTGILEYKNADGSVRRELRLPEEVFAADSLGSYAGAPLTIGHPGILDANSLPKYRVGGVLGEARADGELVGATLRIEDATAVAQVESGALVELSAGYRMSYDATPGEWNGQRYDGVQKNIRLNHIALLPSGAGRSGAVCALRMDADAELTADPKVSELEVALAALQAELAAFRAQAESQVAAAVAELNTVKADAKDAHDQVSAFKRLCLETEARGVLGADARFDGQSDDQVRSAVVARAFPDVRLDGVEIMGAYKLALAHKPVRDTRVDAIAHAIKSPVTPEPSPRDKMLSDLRKRAGVGA